jgi:hypothetical protein
MRIFNKDGLICALLILFLTGCPSLREEAEYVASLCDGTASPFSSGSGTASNPFIVCSASQLKNISNDLTAHYRLGKNISLSGVSFSPIGTNDTTGFSGTLDGAGFTVSGWSYSNASDPFAIAFVRKLSAGGVIKNLTLSSLVLTGNNIVAGFAGISAGTITSVTLKNSTLTGKSLVAGLVGEATGAASVSSSTLSSNLLTSTANGSRMQDTAQKTSVGGIAGVWSSTGSVSDSIVSSTRIDFSKDSFFHHDSNTATGGVVGILDVGGSVLRSSYVNSSTGIEGYFNVGGVVGLSYGAISNSSAKAFVVSGNSCVGGVVGFSTGSIHQTSFVGTILGADVDDGISNGVIEGAVGGIVGVLSGSLSESFFSGTLTGDQIIGGVAGIASSANVDDCYVHGTVEGDVAPVAGAFGILDSGTVDRVYVYSNSITSSLGAAVQAFIGTATSSPVLTHVFFYDIGLPSAQGGVGISGASAIQDINNFTGYEASSKWRTPASYSGRSILSPVLAWECNQTGVSCAP